MENQPSYYSIIPAHVRYSDALEANAKLLYSEITALCNTQGYCWASDQYFADLYKVDLRTVKRWIFSLKSENFIFIETIKKGFQTTRRIFISKEIKEMFTKGQKCPYRRGKNVPIGGAKMPPIILNKNTKQRTTTTVPENVVVDEAPSSPVVVVSSNYENDGATHSDSANEDVLAALAEHDKQMEIARLLKAKQDAKASAELASLEKKKQMLESQKKDIEEKKAKKKASVLTPEQSAIKEMVDEFEFSQKDLAWITQMGQEDVKSALQALKEFSEGKELANKVGACKTALREKWKPSVKSTSNKKTKQEIEDEAVELVHQNKMLGRQMIIARWNNFSKDRKPKEAHENVEIQYFDEEMKLRTIKISYADKDFREKMRKYLEFCVLKE